MTLYVRSPGKLPQDIKDNVKVTVIQGGFDADLETIRPAITNGAEAIVSTAGPMPANNGKGTVSRPSSNPEYLLHRNAFMQLTNPCTVLS